jgi:hypothetical protein
MFTAVTFVFTAAKDDSGWIIFVSIFTSYQKLDLSGTRSTLSGRGVEISSHRGLSVLPYKQFIVM